MSGLPVGELACLTAAAAWAVAVAWFQGPIERHGAWAVSLTKNVVATVFLGATVVMLQQTRVLLEASPSALALVAASGLAGLALGDTALFAAVGRLGAHRALLLQTLGPVFTALLAFVALGERLGAPAFGGAALVLIGVVVVLSAPRASAASLEVADGAVLPPDDGSRHEPVSTTGAAVGRWSLVGVGFGALAALGQGSGVVLAKAGMTELPVLAASFVRLGSAVVGLAVVLAFLGRLGPSLVVWRSPRASGRILGPTVLGTYLGFLLMMAGVAWAPATVAAVLLSTSPVFSLFIEAWMGAAPLTPRSVGGTLLAVGGVVVLTLW